RAYQEAKAARNAEEEQRKKSEAARQAEQEQRQRADAARQAEEGQRSRAEAALETSRRHLMTAQLQRVAAVMERDPMTGYELLHDENACPPNLRDFAWGWYARYCNRLRHTLWHGSGVRAVALSRDGQLLASGVGGVQTGAVFPVSVLGVLG